MPLLRTLLGLAAALLLLSGCFPLAVGGVAATGMMIEDRRTTGTYVEDESIEWKVNARLAERIKENFHINTTSYNRQVLLTGEVLSESTKAAAAEIAKGVPNVRNVVNELTVAGASSLAARGNDAAVTAAVKSRFVGSNQFSPLHVKVTTEGGVVYLMGLVTRAEADAAAEIARTTTGVSRVVKVFEYVVVTPREAAK